MNNFAPNTRFIEDNTIKYIFNTVKKYTRYLGTKNLKELPDAINNYRPYPDNCGVLLKAGNGFHMPSFEMNDFMQRYANLINFDQTNIPINDFVIKTDVLRKISFNNLDNVVYPSQLLNLPSLIETNSCFYNCKNLSFEKDSTMPIHFTPLNMDYMFCNAEYSASGFSGYEITYKTLRANWSFWNAYGGFSGFLKIDMPKHTSINIKFNNIQSQEPPSYAQLFPNSIYHNLMNYSSTFDGIILNINNYKQSFSYNIDDITGRQALINYIDEYRLLDYGKVPFTYPNDTRWFVQGNIVRKQMIHNWIKDPYKGWYIVPNSYNGFNTCLDTGIILDFNSRDRFLENKINKIVILEGYENYNNYELRELFNNCFNLHLSNAYIFNLSDKSITVNTRENGLCHNYTYYPKYEITGELLSFYWGIRKDNTI